MLISTCISDQGYFASRKRPKLLRFTEYTNQVSMSQISRLPATGTELPVTG